tara:strand:+ start:10762 stop:11139 length:378 start_codon:yes stop_codon:yes gene_type:complete
MKTHDYSERLWGKNYEILNLKNSGYELDLCGWGYGISVGDFIILKNNSDTTRYKILSIKYESNPGDMWFAEALFSPREPEVYEVSEVDDITEEVSNTFDELKNHYDLLTEEVEKPESLSTLSSDG